MKLKKQLKEIQEKQQQCKFFLKMEDEEYTLHGYILDMNDEFMYVREVVDFTVDGYRIFKLEYLQEARNNKFDKACTRIYRAEGLKDTIYTYEHIDLNNYQVIFKSVKKQFKYAIIESMYKGEMDFDIGEITKAGKKNVEQLYFDGAGRVNERPTVIPYSDILIVGFANHYLNVFQKYLK